MCFNKNARKKLKKINCADYVNMNARKKPQKKGVGKRKPTLKDTARTSARIKEATQTANLRRIYPNYVRVHARQKTQRKRVRRRKAVLKLA